MESLTTRTKATESPSGLLSLSLGFKLFSMLPVLTIFVILLTLLWVAEHFVGFIDLLKLIFCTWIVWIQIGMPFPRQLSVRFLYIILRCVFIHTKNLIIIDISHNSIRLINLLHACK